MTLDEAIKECVRWHRYLDKEREKTKILQKAARCAKRGDKAGAKRLKDVACGFAPTVFDGAKLEQATKVLIKTVKGKQND